MGRDWKQVEDLADRGQDNIVYLDIVVVCDTVALVKRERDGGDLLGHTDTVSVSVTATQLASLG